MFQYMHASMKFLFEFLAGTTPPHMRRKWSAHSQCACAPTSSLMRSYASRSSGPNESARSSQRRRKWRRSSRRSLVVTADSSTALTSCSVDDCWSTVEAALSDGYRTARSEMTAAARRTTARVRTAYSDDTADDEASLANKPITRLTWAA